MSADKSVSEHITVKDPNDHNDPCAIVNDRNDHKASDSERSEQ